MRISGWWCQLVKLVFGLVAFSVGTSVNPASAKLRPCTAVFTDSASFARATHGREEVLVKRAASTEQYNPRFEITISGPALGLPSDTDRRTSAFEASHTYDALISNGSPVHGNVERSLRGTIGEDGQSLVASSDLASAEPEAYGYDSTLLLRVSRYGVATNTTGASSRLVPGGGLAAHEAGGGHTLARHVGRSDADLLARVQNSNVSGASGFTSRSVAESSIAEVMAGNQGAITTFMNSPAQRVALNGSVAGGSGRFVAQGSTTVQSVNGVRVVLEKAPNMSGGYRILTAFPTP